MIDLHMHSTYSDGTCTPEELVRQAAEARLRAAALTDHETTDGVWRFVRAAEAAGIEAVPAVEIATDHSPGVLHLLGYFVDYANRQFVDYLRWLRQRVSARNEEIVSNLRAVGVRITLREVRQLAGEDDISRMHFAELMVRKGFVVNRKEAFRKYLARGRAGYVEHHRLRPEDGIELIRSVGGVAVLAHPFTLAEPFPDQRRVLARLREAGLEGLEAYYVEHAEDLQKEYLKMAAELNLVASGGSDFHGATAPKIKIGVGFGNLNVPYAALDALRARRP